VCGGGHLRRPRRGQHVPQYLGSGRYLGAGIPHAQPHLPAGVVE